MNFRIDLVRATILAGITSVAGVASSQYTGILLSPTGYTNSAATAVNGDYQVGFSTPPASGNASKAMVWNKTSASQVNYNPTGYLASNLSGIEGSIITGNIYGGPAGNNYHAAVWIGGPNNFIDLNPAGYTTTNASGIRNGQIVGAGNGAATGGTQQALLWNSFAPTAVNLAPANSTSSRANATDGITQVGDATYTALSGNRAVMWKGSAASAVNLHPSWATSSFAEGVSGSKQVGRAIVSGSSKAILWNGSATDYVDLTPVGATASASDILGNVQVGNYSSAATGNLIHAAMWTGTASSMVDLHSALNGLPIAFVSSSATSVAANGDIAGYAFDANGANYAVMWTAQPVPEPATMIVVALGSLAVLRRKKKSQA